MINRILFRVDANQEIGYGHLVRCLAIADSINNIEIIFASTDNLHSYFKNLNNNKLRFKFLLENKDFYCHVKKTDIVIIDGYKFDLNYQKEIGSLGAKIICIDDLGKRELFADVILNPTPSISFHEYLSPIHTQFYFGLNYVLLRKSFLHLAQKKQISKTSKSIFICFGGSDPLNVTKTALEVTISSCKFNEIHCVLGPGYVFLETVNKFASDKVFFHYNLQEKEMASLMEKCEYGILPCSGILIEGIAAKMKIISGYYIDNQKLVYENHLKLKTFIDAENFSSHAIQKAILNINHTNSCSNIIDGHSIERVQKIINLLSIEDSYLIRKANSDDSKITFSWANHSNTRKYSFNKEVISWETHLSWFQKKIQSSDCHYLVLELNGVLYGSIRFDIQNKIATISYLVSPECHGKGIGSILLRKGLISLESTFSKNEIDTIQGFVFKENIPSRITFERFGFIQKDKIDTLLFTKKFMKND